eukprot:194205-Chlamydomonas_euryale.AAC.1
MARGRGGCRRCSSARPVPPPAAHRGALPGVEPRRAAPHVQAGPRRAGHPAGGKAAAARRACRRRGAGANVVRTRLAAARTAHALPRQGVCLGMLCVWGGGRGRVAVGEVLLSRRGERSGGRAAPMTFVHSMPLLAPRYFLAVNLHAGT